MGVFPSHLGGHVTLLGTFGLFFTLFLLFARFLPMIAISEVKGVAAQERHSFAPVVTEEVH